MRRTVRVPILWLSAFVASIIGLDAAATDAELERQRIVADPEVQVVVPGQVATVTFVYDSASTTASGLSLRAHYDSTKVTLEGADLLFDTGIAGQQDQLDSGVSWDDGDPSTDRRYLAAWLSLSGGWPGSTQPVPLLRLHFRVNPGATAATDIVLTGDGCNACLLELESPTIQVVGGGLEAAPKPTTVAPDPTTTPTPGFVPTLGQAPDGGFVPQSIADPGIAAIPTLSELGAAVLGAALAASAIALLLRRRG